MSESAVAVRGLARRFGDLWAVRDVSLDIAVGEVFGVLGPNGAGKSTTIRMLCGILAPTSGGGRVLGLDLVSDGEAIKQGIGYMTQAFSLYADLSVEENLRFYAGIHGLPFLRPSPRVAEQLARYSLEERRRQIVGTLSGGWRQRVALACATVHQPRLLILDEPTAGVDPVSRREFWQLVGELARAGTTVLATTHYMDEAERCHRLAFIFRGQVLDVGRPEEVVARRELVAAEVDLTGAVDGVAIAAALRAMDGVDEVEFYGHTLRVVTRQDHDPVALLGPYVGAWPARRVRVSVEDAFVSMVRREEAP